MSVPPFGRGLTTVLVRFLELQILQKHPEGTAMKHIPGKIAKYKVADAIYLLVFETQYELASTFLRFQEHYESPKFRKKIFSLEEFMDWYGQENKGKFSYFKDWAGFNIPSTEFEPFLEGKFDPLLEKEKRLMG